MMGMVLCVAAQGYAQNYKEEMERWRLELTADFDDFEKEIAGEMDDFRREVMNEYLAFLRNPWKEFVKQKPQPVPKEDIVPPVVVPEEDIDKPIESTPIVIKDIVPQVPTAPQPEPIAPIEVVPVVKENFVEFEFFGTTDKVRYEHKDAFRLNTIDEREVAKVMEKLVGSSFDNMIVDCLSIRERRNLSDWAYLCMLNCLAERIYGNSNEARLLVAYVFMQSGYKVRMGLEGGRLYVLFSSKHLIYNRERYKLDGDYYYGLTDLPNNMRISEAVFPKEQSLSLMITKGQLLDESLTEVRTIRSKRYPEVAVGVQANKNMLDFYSSYPTSMLGDNICSRWAMYANMPMPKHVVDGSYPDLLLAIKDMSQLEAVSVILNWVQTGLTYEYDDTVWGHDRAFFPEETLSYPYCDCEDRAILFTRIIRDLLGLKCMLVHYPGHLAAAVCFTETVAGDYISMGGRRFVICDPTFIGAPVGCSMSGTNNSAATVIEL